MALTYSVPVHLGSTAPDFLLTGVDDKNYQLSDFDSARVLVVAFICNHCPYVIATQGRVNRLAQEYSKKGVAWIGISSNDATNYPQDGFEAMKARSKEQNFSFPYLYDDTQAVARAFGAVCTPEFFVYGQEAGSLAPSALRALKYQGRLDDHWQDEKHVTHSDLALALDRILMGQNPDSDQKPALGCSIKWRIHR